MFKKAIVGTANELCLEHCFNRDIQTSQRCGALQEWVCRARQVLLARGEFTGVVGMNR